MLKRIIAVMLALVMLLMLSACGGTRMVTCDGCGADIPVAKNSNITDEWIVFCETCEEEIGPVVEPGN